jgi:hypothetical protein
MLVRTLVLLSKRQFVIILARCLNAERLNAERRNAKRRNAEFGINHTMPNDGMPNAECRIWLVRLG